MSFTVQSVTHRLLSKSRPLSACVTSALSNGSHRVSTAASPNLKLRTGPVSISPILQSSLRPSWGSAVKPMRFQTAAMASSAKQMKVAFEPESFPSVQYVSSVPSAWEGDLLLLAVAEEDIHTEGGTSSLKCEHLLQVDKAAGGAIAECIAWGGFEGKQGTQSRVVRVGSSPDMKAKYVGLVGLGKASKISSTSEWGATCFQKLGAAAAVLAKSQRATSLALACVRPAAEGSGATSLFEDSSVAGQLARGILLGGYESTRFKSKPSPTLSKLSQVHLLGSSASTSAPALEKALADAQAVASGTVLAKFLVEAPPNVCTPTHLAEAARHIAALFPDRMKVEILEKDACEAMNMGLYLGVSEASAEPPKFIHLTYTAPGDATNNKKIALVGKGLTFDSGGYNIKAGPGSMIELMKFDMGGAAATLGAARIVGALAPPGVEVHFIVAACENMVAGLGMRPGDILTSASGKTVEINNTDAEGRLTLADALWYAQEKCGATSIIDSATLTGACIIALGNDIAGLFTPSDQMASAITKASNSAGEKVWRMPMEASYFDQLKSPCADMKNTGSRAGGSITAALFLQQFINEGVEWAHIDMAGPVWDEKAGLPTGFGAALLADWATQQGSS